MRMSQSTFDDGLAYLTTTGATTAINAAAAALGATRTSALKKNQLVDLQP